jgi:hypothetical protein
MDENLSERIRERAYEIWAASGHRDGEAEQHWLAAEREILAASLAAVPVNSSAKRSRSRATPKRQARAS